MSFTFDTSWRALQPSPTCSLSSSIPLRLSPSLPPCVNPRGRRGLYLSGSRRVPRAASSIWCDKICADGVRKTLGERLRKNRGGGRRRGNYSEREAKLEDRECASFSILFYFIFFGRMALRNRESVFGASSDISRYANRER